MAPQNDLRGEIRGVTVPAIWTFICSTAIGCSTVVGCAIWIVGHIESHSAKLDSHEQRIDKLENAVFTKEKIGYNEAIKVRPVRVKVGNAQVSKVHL